MDENTQIFVAESEELLEDMEQALLALENAPNDDDLINRIFRAAHTIKGSAGLFGFDSIIAFTHVVENLLDDIRNCLVPISTELISLFMRCKDQILLMIEDLDSDEAVNYPEIEDLLQLLKAYSASSAANSSISSESSCANNSVNSNNPTQQNQDDPNSSKAVNERDSYHISIRLDQDTFREGFDPAMMFSQLSELGQINQAKVVLAAIPKISMIDSENCHLGWELTLNSTQSKQQIADVLEFIDGAMIKILPPSSQIADYSQLIAELPEADHALGQILLEIGALTQSELQQVLNKQKAEGGLTGDLLISEGIAQPQVVKTAIKTQNKVRKEKQQEREFIRVAADKLDKLVNLVGELVIGGAKISQLAQNRNDVELEESVEEITQSLEEIRETALGLRMTPVANTFNRFHRVVRDIANDLNKKIRLKIIGGDTELDKTVVDRIADPLTHLIRNSMDHGLEMPQQRLQAGKPEEGTITLSAFHQTGYIVIEVKDDGKGLDAEKILTIAKERGLVSENQKMNRSDIYKLIFEPGFSTAKTVNNLSGRGVGMDVVRRNIEALRGTVTIFSEPNQGSRVVLRLPLTLAIIDGFHVKVANESFIVPLDAMVECISLNEVQKKDALRHNYIKLRDEMLPLIHLEKNWRGDAYDQQQQLPDRINLVVVQFDHKKVGLLVDSLHGEVQAVIKPLGSVFNGLSGFAGFTLLGSGQVAMIMDIAELAKSVAKTERKKQDFVERRSRNRVDLNEVLL
ncbi:MAG: chemotaxis protein CheA [Alteromonadaceae bacterium]|nr:chemotaxis protein CheA [Alteromonadaceae bacterium]